jgi:hypothetical protein
MAFFILAFRKSSFKGFFVRMPLDKRKLRQFKKNAFNKMPLIKEHVAVINDETYSTTSRTSL